MRPQEAVQTVMHHRSIVRGVRCLIQRLQRRELQDVPGVDCIGIAQPGLDRGDAELPRALVDTAGGEPAALPARADRPAGRWREPRRRPDVQAGLWLRGRRRSDPCHRRRGPGPPETYPVGSATARAPPEHYPGAPGRTAPPSAPNSRRRGNHEQPVRLPPRAPAIRPWSASAATATGLARPSAARQSRPNRPAPSGPPTAAGLPAGPR